MKNFEIRINVKEYASVNELDDEYKKLLQAANEATKRAYTPYSKFNVGAAVLFENGEIISGCNQENAAYPSGLCAERVTMFYANAKYPNEPIKAIAISSGIGEKLNDDIIYPCGACRQVLVESEKRQGKKIKLIMGSAKSILMLDSVSDSLPFTFDLESYKK